MSLSVKRKGRKFHVDWMVPHGIFIENQEFTIGNGSSFMLELSSPTENCREMSFAMGKKLYEEDPSSMNLHPHAVMVSKDGDEYQCMPQHQLNYWGPVYWRISERKQERLEFQYRMRRLRLDDDRNPIIHLSIILECEPRMKDGETDLLSRLGRLLHSGAGSDVDFIVNGEKIPAHTFIIQESSPVLAAMFQHDMTESTSRTVVVDDIEPVVFRQMLQYLYTGNLGPKMSIESLFIAADKYQVDKLKDLCSSFLFDDIKVENAVSHLVLSYHHSDEWLQEDCIEFIVNKKKEFFMRQDFKDLCFNFPNLFFEVTKQMND